MDDDTTNRIFAELKDTRADLSDAIGVIKGVADIQQMHGEQIKEQGRQITEQGKQQVEFAKALTESSAKRNTIGTGLLLAIIVPSISVIIAAAKLGHVFVGQEVERVEKIIEATDGEISDGDSEREQLIRDFNVFREKEVSITAGHEGEIEELNEETSRLFDTLERELPLLHEVKAKVDMLEKDVDKIGDLHLNNKGVALPPPPSQFRMHSR